MHIEPEIRERIKAVSILCSLLVCLNHAYTVPAGEAAVGLLAQTGVLTQNAVAFALSRISTPFFFLVAGFLFFRALRADAGGLLPAWRREAGKRVRSLAMPFLLVSAWSFALVAALQAVPALGAHAADPLAQRGWPRIAEALFWNPVAYPLWFLRNLFLLCLAAPLLAPALRGRAAPLVLAVAAAAWWLWPEVRATRSVLFFSLGGWLASGGGVRGGVRPRFVVLALAGWLLSAGAQARLVALTGTVDPLLNHLGILTGLAAVWYGAARAPAVVGAPAVQRAAAHSFFIYLMHEPLATLARKAVQAAVDGPQRLLLLSLAWPALALALFAGCLVAATLLERRLPALHRLLVGGRSSRPLRPDPAVEKVA